MAGEGKRSELILTETHSKRSLGKKKPLKFI